MKKLLGLLFKPVLLLLAALSIALLVWFGGPLVAIAQWRPLESVTARIVVIAALLALWLGKRLYAALRDKLANRKLFSALGAKQPAAPAEGGDPAQLEAVRKRFDAALAVMRETRFGGKGGLLARFGGRGRYVYQLPWYVFIGPPGSGKTTALLNSGLQFPLAERLGNDPIRGIGGTRNCDWWFTDQAVMIDTAGRYTTQDSDAQADANEWRGFLGLLRRHRPRQPINGALVTVSVSDLLQLTPAERDAQAVAVRSRVHDLLETLENDFPVYLLVTKVDLLAGFMEFFGDLDRDRREQVWGTTFPYRPGAGTGEALAALGERYDALVARIEALTMERMQAERDPARRAAIFGFVQQLAALRPALMSFVETAFPATQLTRTPALRGVYLTSGTQESSPIDRVIGGLSRQFGLQSRMLPALRPSGRSFFLTRLLHDVVFPESPLAGTNLRWERRLAALKWTATLGALAIAAVAIGGWSVSYLNNARYVDTVARKVDTIKAALTGRVAGTMRLKELLPLYAAVRGLPVTDEVDPEAPRWSQGFGLFQAPKLSEAAEQSYHRLLQQTLAPVLAARVADVLRRGAANPELQYEALKTYVMLREPGRLDPAAVKGWVAFDLDTSGIADLTPDERRALLAHVDALLSRSGFQDSVVPDTELIVQARAALTRTPFPQRVYNRVKRQGIGDFPDFRITNVAGPSAAAVFRRHSGASLNDGVPGFYTYDAYHKGFTKAIGEVLNDLAAEEVWVLGVRNSENARRATDPALREALVDEVKRQYLLDYAAVWERFVADVAIVRGGSLTETIQTARLLSAVDSPLPQLLRAIVREVTLTDTDGKTAVDKAADRASETFKDTRQTLSRLLGTGAGAAPSAPSARIESIVDQRFESLRRMVRTPPGATSAPIDQTVALINELYQLMTTTETVVRGGGTPPASDVPNKVKSEAGRLPEPVRSMLSGLAAAGASQALGATRSNISQNLATSVGEFCSKAIGGRYPFSRTSRIDVTPDDFARLFGPGGVLDEFFQKNLAAFVDTTVKPWRFRRIGDTTMADSESLVQFQRAAEIRSVFFGGGAKGPAMRIEMKPIEMDPSILQFNLDVDGQVVRYAHGPTVPQTVQWPGPKGSSQIRMQIAPPGPSGTSGMVFEGPWAMNRMFDRAQIDPLPQPEKFRATFSIDDRRVQFEVTTNSVQNPFRLPDLQAFRCPSRL